MGDSTERAQKNQNFEYKLLEMSSFNTNLGSRSNQEAEAPIKTILTEYKKSVVAVWKIYPYLHMN